MLKGTLILQDGYRKHACQSSHHIFLGSAGERKPTFSPLPLLLSHSTFLAPHFWSPFKSGPFCSDTCA